jgi:hypothetical protein
MAMPGLPLAGLRDGLGELSLMICDYKDTLKTIKTEIVAL